MKNTHIITSRKNGILSVLSWIFILLCSSVIYNYISIYASWSPIAMSRLDTIYIITRTFIIITIVSNIISFLFYEIEKSFLLEKTITKRFFPLIKVVVLFLAWCIGFFYVFDFLNINTTSILTGAGIGGALLAIASRDIITNLFGSLSILLSRTFEIGEIIRVRLKPSTIYEGLVEEITLTYTKITNITGEVIFIPNRLIYTETVENLSRRRFFDYTFRIPFKKQSNFQDIKTRMRIIEGKIADYDPIEILFDTEIPNANDFVYKITVMLPEENEVFEDEMRHFLMEFIFIEDIHKPATSDLQK